MSDKTWAPFSDPWGPSKELLLEKPSLDKQLEASWADVTGRDPVPTVARMSDDELRAFVNSVLASHVFLSSQVRGADLPMVFLPVALGAFKDWTPEQLEEIGVLYAPMSAALPRAINGNPVFAEFRILHRDDWRRASQVINREIERRQHMPL